MLHRRLFLNRAITAGMLAVGVAVRAQEATEPATPPEWSSRVLRMPAESKQVTPPVVTSAKLHPNGTQLISAGDDHLLRVWNLETGRVEHQLAGHSDWVRAVAITATGDVLASAGNDGRVLLWNTANWQSRELAALPQALATLDFTSDGTHLAVAGWSNYVRVYEVASGKLLHELVGPESNGSRGDLRSLAFSPDAKLLAVGGRTGKIRIWNMSDLSVLTDVPAHGQRIRSLMFSSDSSAILSAGEEGLVRLTPISQGFTGFALPRMNCRIMAIALCGDNQLAVAGSDNRIYLWNLKTREPLGILGQHTGTITTLDCAGETLVSSGYDTSIRLWKLNGSIAEKVTPKNRVSARPSFRLE